MSESFRSSATIDSLRQRAKIVRDIRQFFDARDFFEVDTPVISHDIVVDRNLEPISIDGNQFGSACACGKTFWLQTSPEFAMKRLLASGATSIYQIAHAFRSGERGNRHNPEFAMLEWYRVGDDMQAGMQLLSDFARSILNTQPAEFLSYAEAFQRFAGCNVLTGSSKELHSTAAKNQLDISAIRDLEDLDEWRNLLLAELVEPNLGVRRPAIVYDWPASQSALAIVRGEQPPVAERFELYINGVELANGYHELLDASELLSRNQKINQQRESDGKRSLPAESLLLEAMQSGMPSCSGVALGVDRLVMLALNKSSIDEVIPFPIENC